MASHCYLTGPSGELFVEYLVRHCALSDRDQYDHESSKVGFAFIVKTIEGLHPTFMLEKIILTLVEVGDKEVEEK